MTREVTVRGSSEANCKTKMIREWLKVHCSRTGALVPTMVTASPPVGVLAFTFVGNDFTDLVVQIVRDRETHASFSWSNNSTRELTLKWSIDAARPVLYFTEGQR
jgi:hypothetical protein